MTDFNAKKYLEDFNKIRPYPEILSKADQEKEREEFIKRHGSNSPDVHRENKTKKE